MSPLKGGNSGMSPTVRAVQERDSPEQTPGRNDSVEMRLSEKDEKDEEDLSHSISS